MVIFGISSSCPPGAPTNFPLTASDPAPETSSHQAFARASPLTAMSQRPLNCWSSVAARHVSANRAQTDLIALNVAEPLMDCYQEFRRCTPKSIPAQSPDGHAIALSRLKPRFQLLRPTRLGIMRLTFNQ